MALPIPLCRYFTCNSTRETFHERWRMPRTWQNLVGMQDDIRKNVSDSTRGYRSKRPNVKTSHSQNVPSQNVPKSKRPKSKRPKVITSLVKTSQYQNVPSQNVPKSKRPGVKTSQKSKCPKSKRPKSKRPRVKMSQVKTSQVYDKFDSYALQTNGSIYDWLVGLCCLMTPGLSRGIQCHV